MSSLTKTETKIAESIGSWLNFALKASIACLIFKKIMKF